MHVSRKRGTSNLSALYVGEVAELGLAADGSGKAEDALVLVERRTACTRTRSESRLKVDAAELVVRYVSQGEVSRTLGTLPSLSSCSSLSCPFSSSILPVMDVELLGVCRGDDAPPGPGLVVDAVGLRVADWPPS